MTVDEQYIESLEGQNRMYQKAIDSMLIVGGKKEEFEEFISYNQGLIDLLKELRVYNDAYKMACRELGYANKDRSTKHWNDYFLQKAREQE